MAGTAVAAPTLDTVSLVCLVIGPDGMIRWANAAGAELGWSSCGTGSQFTQIVGADDRPAAGAMLSEAGSRGHAERIICIRGNGTGESRYLHCILNRATADDNVPGMPGHDFGGDMVLQGWDVTNSVVRERDLERRAHRDPLTGVANRWAFMARLDHELSVSRLPSSEVAVFYADVDDFKAVNDTHGHEAGDRVLVELAGRLLASLRPADMLGRMGGDEFAMICPDLFGWPAAIALIERLRTVAAEPVTSPSGEIRVSLSLGAAFASPGDHGEDATGLLARADQQMFRAKPELGETAIVAARTPIDLR